MKSKAAVVENKAGLERELTALEKQFWTAMKDGDGARAVSLSEDPGIVVGPQGVGEIDRKSLAGMIENAPYEIEDFKLEDVRVRSITDEVAIVAYKVKEKLAVDGESVSLDAFDTSVWVRRDGSWTCALHTETIAGDPFGRDRARDGR